VVADVFDREGESGKGKAGRGRGSVRGLCLHQLRDDRRPCVLVVV